MSWFLGTYSITIDEAGRFTVPAKIRDVLEEEYGPKLVVCAEDDYLMVFPRREWTENEKKQEHLNAFDDEDRKRLRKYYSRAAECKVQAGGKITIQSNLRELVGLKKDAVLVGMSKTFEIWSQDKWARDSG